MTIASKQFNSKQLSVSKKVNKLDNLSFSFKLEERTQRFFEEIIGLCKDIPRSTINDEIIRQLIRASGSIASNYIEANESLSKKDFYYRIKVCRKESKECIFG